MAFHLLSYNLSHSYCLKLQMKHFRQFKFYFLSSIPQRKISSEINILYNPIDNESQVVYKSFYANKQKEE